MALNNPGIWSWNHITGATTVQVFAGKGILHAIIVNTAVTTIAAYDVPSAGTTGQIAAVGAAGIGSNLTYDAAVTNGLSIVTTGTGDITVLYST